MSNFADNFRNIQFHRVPFLSTRVLTLLIPHMRRLEVLGIYKCQLIHLGEGEELLNIIRTDRPLGKEYQVQLDWYPNYHDGPEFRPGRLDCTGRYGVTWDDSKPNVRNVRVAIWCLVYSLVAQANRHGIDLVGPHTAFRKWLDDSPCLMVEDTLQAIKRYLGEGEPIELEEFVGWIIFDQIHGDFRRIRKPEKECVAGRLW